MYNSFYAEAFIITKLKKEIFSPAIIDQTYDEEGNIVSEQVLEPETATCVPDLPVPVTSYQLAIDNKVFHDGQQIPLEYEGRDCLVHCTFKAELLPEVQKEAGYIEGVGEVILGHPRYAEFYSVTDEGGNPVPYIVNCSKGYRDE